MLLDTLSLGILTLMGTQVLLRFSCMVSYSRLFLSHQYSFLPTCFIISSRIQGS